MPFSPGTLVVPFKHSMAARNMRTVNTCYGRKMTNTPRGYTVRYTAVETLRSVIADATRGSKTARRWTRHYNRAILSAAPQRDRPRRVHQTSLPAQGGRRLGVTRKSASSTQATTPRRTRQERKSIRTHRTNVGTRLNLRLYKLNENKRGRGGEAKESTSKV